jgi:hypothetical protein
MERPYSGQIWVFWHNFLWKIAQKRHYFPIKFSVFRAKGARQKVQGAGQMVNDKRFKAQGVRLKAQGKKRKGNSRKVVEKRSGVRPQLPAHAKTTNLFSCNLRY